MGRGMAKNLIEKGNLESPLKLYNRTTTRAVALKNEVGSRASIGTSIAETVAGADIIFTSLSNDDTLKETMSQALQSEIVGKTFVDCSTVHPEAANDLAEMASSKGADFVSMPVLGSPGVAASSQLLCLLSGSSRAIDLVKPYITGVIGRQIIEFRDELAGKGQVLKLIANMFILNVNEITAEGLTFAEKASVDPHRLLEMLSVLFGGPYSVYGARMIGGDYHKKEAQVPVGMALKDAHHAMRVAEEVKSTVPSLRAAAENLEAVRDQRGPLVDSSSVYGLCRLRNGLPFENVVKTTRS
ncbi:hypothetical protein M409DRAFT_62424 [Zasmidium cellare ATCC 36951]|uniref:6-phosphogluconate dehydrogenase NADP-binding domain-containing protein n=1 Tax=Zasmidium cellare ATCC 36951 TaxID=1080233 RepID=A0A6A6CZL9_ZASCE|nr:uncharacterized protein M409DRAFT_62424 [Zasmidium cellare ATCC 36951]KAF2172687.1 hypothetical protein M409DRAFT_62424 [Zasmidium cellare ATCC 36951]